MKKEELQKFAIVDIDDLAEAMIDDATKGKNSTSVMFYEDAVKLTKSLMRDQNVGITDIRISDPLFDGYDNEYYVSLTEDFELFVEPAMSESKKDKSDIYLFDASDCIYIMDNVPQNIYGYITGAEGYVVVDANNKLSSNLMDEFLNTEHDPIPSVTIHIYR